MPRCVKDEINFHKFLNAMRQLHEVTLEQACEGLCSISMMKRIECGDRLPEKQMRDRILARMGVPIEGYEDYLSTEEYEQWELRQKLINNIENKQVAEAEKNLEAYRVYENQNSVEAQYCDAMEFMILQLKNASKEKQREVITHAVGLTMPEFGKGLSEKKLLSEQELNLLTEYVWLHEYGGNPEDEFDWRCKQYKELLNYIEHSRLDNFCRAKVYPKVAYYLCELILYKAKTEENLEMGINACNEAIELLRDSRKLYYFIELVEVLEKLVKEYGFCLRKRNKRDALEVLQNSLEEKKEWQNVIMELYMEYKVSPYMENFCHLYWEMESYCIGDVIRIRRQMFGMTKEQLCEGICSVKTLTRIEHKKVKTQMPIVRALFERLGLCAEYIRARVISSDYEVLKLAERCTQYQNNYKTAEWEKCLKELEKVLYIDIPQNKQFIMESYHLLNFRQKQITKEEFVKRMIETIEYTIPLESIISKEKKFLSRDESTIIYNIGMRIDDHDNAYVTTVRELCKQYEEYIGMYSHIRRYEFLMSGIISYLGNKREYEDSNNLSNRLLKKCLICRRSHVLPNTLYNNLWNNQQRLLCNREDAIYQQVLKRCIILSRINKNENLANFFEHKLLGNNN